MRQSEAQPPEPAAATAATASSGRQLGATADQLRGVAGRFSVQQ
ncbi:hypothetical protein [Krasilnikovia sp. MM14-A1004]